MEEKTAMKTTESKQSAKAKETAKDSGKLKSNVKPQESAKQEKTSGTGMVVKMEGQVVKQLPESQLQKEFKRRTGIIKKQMNNIQQSFLVIAFQLHWIKEHDMYQSMGFKNIYEFAEIEYGIGRSSCGNLICIIDNYAERDKAGHVIESLPERYRNFTASQLIAMVGMPEESRKRITPDMSVRLINRIRKQEAQARIGTNRIFPADVKTEIVPETPKTETVHEVPKADVVPEVPKVDKAPEAFSDTETVQESSVKSSPATDKEPSAVTATPAKSDAKPGTEKKTEAGTASTLLTFDSYSNYQKEQEHMHSLVADIFRQSITPVIIKIVCEQGIA